MTRSRTIFTLTVGFLTLIAAGATAHEKMAPKESRAYLYSYNLPSSGVALEGYCPVAYFAVNKPVRGKPEYASTCHDVTYYFVSADAGPSDQTALIKQAQGGDRQAFETLVRGHYDVMYRVAFKWCGDRSDAEDITQNACIKLARSIGTFRFQSAFRTWLYRLVINAAKDWAKAVPDRMPDQHLDSARSQLPAGEDRVYAMQIMAYVRTLPEREKVALILVVAEGLSHREVATVMDCKESTVSWYIHEARKKLKSFQEQERRYG